jgi:hypothetical protein
MVAIFYIVYDKGFAKNLAMNLLITAYVNSLLKDIIMDPRPATNYDIEKVSPENPAGLIETSYGFPSGHTQSAVSTWGYIAYHFREKIWVIIVMAIIIFLVSISRMIIGVHDLQDVIGGALIGLALLVLFIFLEPPLSRGFNKLGMPIQIVLVVIASLALLLLGTFLFPTTGMQLLPSPPSFTDTGNYGLVGGVILGLGVGYILENKYVKYDPKNIDIKWKIINLIIGMVIVFVVFFGLEFLNDIFNSVYYRYARYAIVAFILTFVVPLIFTKINKTRS